MKLRNHKVVVCGGGGFIGGHLVKSLLDQGIDVRRAVDIKPAHEWYQQSPNVENLILDLKEKSACESAVPEWTSCSIWLPIWAAWALLKTTKPCAC